MKLWFRQVKVCPMEGKVAVDFAVGYVDSRLDFLVNQLVLRKGFAQVAFEVVQSLMSLLEPFIELLLRILSLEFRQLDTDVVSETTRFSLAARCCNNSESIIRRRMASRIMFACSGEVSFRSSFKLSL